MNNTKPIAVYFTDKNTNETIALNVTGIETTPLFSEVKDEERIPLSLTNNVQFTATLSGEIINPKFMRKVIFKGHPFKYLRWRLKKWVSSILY